MTDDHPAVQPLSGILEDLLREDALVTVGEITDRVARRGFGLLMIVLALPSLIPTIPLGSVIIGLLYVLLSLQMLWGLERPWLPRGFRAYRLRERTIAALRDRGVPFLRRIERRSRLRPLPIDERITIRLVAIAILVLGVILMGPLPLINTLPALTALILGVGMINRDGVFVGVGLVLTAGVVALAVASAGLLAQFVIRTLEYFRLRQ